MIAKAKSIAHGGVSLGYITRQGKAQVVKLNHLPEDASPQAIYGYMKLHQKLREEELQCRPLKNNMIRMEISPSKEESEGQEGTGDRRSVRKRSEKNVRYDAHHRSASRHKTRL